MMWDEGAVTDRAIELLNICAAKTDADGNVVPRHRYSRCFKHVATHLKDLEWAPQSETVTIALTRGAVTVSIVVTNKDGSYWEQEGTAGISDGAYDWYALATCRALLNYTTDDGETMTEEQVIAMLEGQRRAALESAAISRR